MFRFGVEGRRYHTSNSSLPSLWLSYSSSSVLPFVLAPENAALCDRFASVAAHPARALDTNTGDISPWAATAVQWGPVVSRIESLGDHTCLDSSSASRNCPWVDSKYPWPAAASTAACTAGHFEALRFGASWAISYAVPRHKHGTPVSGVATQWRSVS